MPEFWLIQTENGQQFAVAKLGMQSVDEVRYHLWHCAMRVVAKLRVKATP